MIEWTSELSVNNKVLDEEHKKLISMINDLQSRVYTEITGDDINLTLFLMIEYAENHLNNEEKLMKQAGFPGYLNHKFKHDEFRSKIKDYKDRNLEEDEGIGQEILFFLQKWFISHIKGDDKEYIPYLQQE